MKTENNLDFYNDFFSSLIRKLAHKDVDNSLVCALAENAHLHHYRKKEYVITRNEKQKFLYFVVSGSYRCFCVKENGHELTNNFMIHRGEPFIAAASFERDSMPVDSIQALEDGDLILVPLQIVKNVCAEYPWVNEIIVREICASFEKYHDLMKARSLKPSERYLWLHKQYPELEKRIQSQYLASYLDMDKANYSRLHASRI